MLVVSNDGAAVGDDTDADEQAVLMAHFGASGRGACVGGSVAEANDIALVVVVTVVLGVSVERGVDVAAPGTIEGVSVEPAAPAVAAAGATDALSCSSPCPPTPPLPR